LVLELAVPVESIRGPANKRATVERRGDDALSTLKFSAIADTRATDSQEGKGDTALGIAFVAPALGKKVPRVPSCRTAGSMPECCVELTSTQRKTKTPVPAAPPNSVDSIDTGSEARFSLSDVHVGYLIEAPETSMNLGEVNSILSAMIEIEPITTATIIAIDERALFVAPIPSRDAVAAFSTAMLEVAAHEEVTEEPVAPGEIQTPVRESADVAPEEITNARRSGQTPEPVAIVPVPRRVDAVGKTRYDQKQKMIREIAASQLLREELAKRNPNLVSAASFLREISSTEAGYNELKEMTEARIRGGLAERGMASTPEAGVEVAANVVDAANALDADVVAIMPLASVREPIVEVPAPEADAINRLGPGDDETGAVSVADPVMSVGSSSGDEDQSRSSDGSYVSRSGNRKRMAEESPERDQGESSRREFPGRVSRSAAGCRIYVPEGKDDKPDCPGRILNDDGSVMARMTVQQDCPAVVGTGEGVTVVGMENPDACSIRDETAGDLSEMAPAVQITPVPSVFPVTLGKTSLLVPPTQAALTHSNPVR